MSRRVITGTGPDRGVRPDPLLQKWLRDRYGLNPFNEPNYKLVWGADWTQTILMPYPVYDSNGNRTGERFGWITVPVYPEWQNCYHLAGWKSQESVGSQETWDRAFTVWENGQRLLPVGARPPRGDYVSRMIFFDTDRNVPVYPARVDLELGVRLTEERIHRARRSSPAQVERDAYYDYEKDMELKKARAFDRMWGAQVPHTFGDYVTLDNVSHAKHLGEGKIA